MKEFVESKIKFQFDEQYWNVLQYDAITSDFKKYVHLSGTKAVDFVGIYNQNTIVFFEIKSFRGFGSNVNVQNRLQGSMEELSTEIAQKVRDSVSVIAGLSRTIKTPFWAESEGIISNVNKQLMIIAWIEENNSRQKKAEMGTRLRKLKQKLSWLSSDSDIYIENIRERHIMFDGFSAINI